MNPTHAPDPSAAATAPRDAALEAQLARRLTGCRLGQPVQAYPALASTMDTAWELAAAGAAEGALVVALRQELGRGRLGRPWASPDGGAYLSLLLRPKRPRGEAPQLALVAGLAAAETLRDTGCLYPAIRWPNDLLIHGKKIGGILTEAREGAVVIGIGINVSADLSLLPEGSTSLAAEGVAHVSREDLVAGFCRQLQTWYDAWTARGFGPVREALRPWIGLFGRPVKLTVGAQQLEGVAHDLDEQGRLVMRLDSGMLRVFDAGEVTLLRSSV
jgi:BirA family biotin operon repressor/biotin-[acetyl-CoA-carboxylase] ligase